MKQGIMGMGLVFTLLLAVATIMALGTEHSMRELLDKTVSTVVYQSLEEHMVTGEDLNDITQMNINLMATGEGISVVSVEVDEVHECVKVVLQMEYQNFFTTRMIQSSRTAIVERGAD